MTDREFLIQPIAAEPTESNSQTKGHRMSGTEPRYTSEYAKPKVRHAEVGPRP